MKKNFILAIKQGLAIGSLAFFVGCNSGSSSASSPYTINLPTNGRSVSLNPNFLSDTTNGNPNYFYQSNINLKYDAQKEALVIDFNNTNDLYVAQNNYYQNNTNMWQQEVFEMFISDGSASPTKYVEIEINPNNALFSGWVGNPNGDSPESFTFFDGNASGIETNVNKLSDSWNGEIIFPLAILGTEINNYRLNFFRIVSLESHDVTQSWGCTATTCSYLAWSPTFSGAEPAFHVTKYFGYLNLVNNY